MSCNDAISTLENLLINFISRLNFLGLRNAKLSHHLFAMKAIWKKKLKIMKMKSYEYMPSCLGIG